MTSQQKSTPEIEVIKEVYAAINRNDIPALRKYFDPEIERVEFEGSPNGATYRGYEAFEAPAISARATWAEGSCNPKEFFVKDNKVVVLVQVLVRLKDKADWIDGRVADAFAFRNGKVIQMNSYFKKEDAMKWAGL